ncbi:hypothetical protein C8J56DRAFT_969592 [Mycena floridula]|nr:hypothetical protein C8J56DRAFT_969592 [Mycena floridula]
MSTGDPYTPDNCGANHDIQLIKNGMAGLLNQSLSLECVPASLDVGIQSGPTFHACQFYADLCLGKIRDQHACAVGNCISIDWTQNIAKTCSSAILSYSKQQPVGIGTPCCDGDGCTDSVLVANPDASQRITCASSQVTLWMCVSDGNGVECANTSTDDICSGNFTSLVGGGGSNSSPTGASTVISSSTVILSSTGISSLSFGPQTSTTQISTTPNAGNGLGTTDIITIVTSVIGGLAALGSIVAFLVRLKKKRRRAATNLEQGPPSVSAGTPMSQTQQPLVIL